MAKAFRIAVEADFEDDDEDVGEGEDIVAHVCVEGNSTLASDEDRRPVRRVQ